MITSDKIIQRFERNKVIYLLSIKNGRFPYVRPQTYFFKPESVSFFNDVIQILTEKGFRVLDLNQYVTVTPEDYNMSLTYAGFRDETETKIVKNIFENNETKKNIIIRAKLNHLNEVIDEQTVLKINYNDLYLQNSVLFAYVRTWLKDGYLFNHLRSGIPVQALILCETEKELYDFCMYGVWAEEF